MVIASVTELPLVSVVIPVHRGGPYVREAVRSVLAQSMQRLEVIVVSDGCPEDLSDLERMDPRVRVLRREHAGVSVARNAGVAASAGEYVAFLDEDDTSCPDRLDWQVRALDTTPLAGMCDGKFQVVDEQGVRQGTPIGKHANYLDMLALQFPLLSTVTVRRSVFQEAGGFDPTLTTAEDIDFFLRMAMQGQVVFVPEVVTDYRRHTSNTTKGVWDVHPILTKHRQWAESSGNQECLRAVDLGMRRNRRNASLAAFNAARAARRRGQTFAGALQLLLSLYRAPSLMTSLTWHHLTAPSHDAPLPADAGKPT